MKRLMLLTLVSVIFFLCTPQAFTQDTEPPLRVGWIMESQGLGDGGFNDVVDLALDELKKDMGIKVIMVPRLDLYIDQAIKNLLELGVDVIIASDEGGMAGAMSEAARLNPDVKFILIGAAGAPLPNLASAIFEEDEAGYMAGFIAGTVTRTGVVGFIGGGTFEPILRFERGFTRGVSDANAGAEVLIKYVAEGEESRGLYDSKETKKIALKMAGSNADVLFCASGSGVIGAINGAEKMGVWFVGFRGDLRRHAPKTVLTSVVYRFDVPVKRLISNIINGEFVGGTYVLGFQDDAFGISDLSNPESNIGSDKARKIRTRMELLASGKVDVPDYLDERRGLTIIVSSLLNKPPYEFIDKKGRYQGYVIDVMGEVGRRLGKELIYKNFEGERTTSGLEAMRPDIEPMMMVDEERIKSYITTQPWGLAESVLVVLESDIHPEEVSELIARNVGVTAGGIEESYVRKIAGIFLESYSSTELALIALTTGEVDAVIANREEVRYFIEESLRKKDFIVIEKPVLISPFSVAMPKPGDEQFLSEIERVLKSMETDGTLEELSDKWFD